MNYSQIILFSTLFNLLINNNCFSSSPIKEYLDYKDVNSTTSTNEQNTVSEKAIDNKEMQNSQNILFYWKQIDKEYNHNLTPNIILRNMTFKSIPNIKLCNSSTQICNTHKSNQRKCDELYSDLEDILSCLCNTDSKDIINNSNSRKSTGVSPSLANQEIIHNNIEEFPILQIIQRNQLNNNKKRKHTIRNIDKTPVKKDLLTNKEQKIIQYIKTNFLNNNQKQNNSLKLIKLKKTNVPMQYLNINHKELEPVQQLKNKIISEIKDTNNEEIIIRRLNKYVKPMYKKIMDSMSTSNKNKIMKELYNSNKKEIDYLNNLLLQDIEDPNGCIERFIDNSKSMTGIYDPVYYNNQYDILNNTIDKTHNNQRQNLFQFCSKQYGNTDNLQSIMFHKLPSCLNELLRNLDSKKNSAISNYYDTCIVNQDSINIMKNASINNEHSVTNITNYFYNLKLSDNISLSKGEILNKFADVNLKYKKEHINNIIEIYEQWQDIYNKYSKLRNKLIKK